MLQRPQTSLRGPAVPPARPLTPALAPATPSPPSSSRWNGACALRNIAVRRIDPVLRPSNGCFRTRRKARLQVFSSDRRRVSTPARSSPYLFGIRMPPLYRGRVVASLSAFDPCRQEAVHASIAQRSQCSIQSSRSIGDSLDRGGVQMRNVMITLKYAG